MICFYTQMILLPLSYCKLQSCSIPINVWKVSSLSFSWLLSLTVVHVHIAVHHVVHHVVHGMCLSTIPCMCTISCTLQCMTCACAPCTLCTSPLQRRRGSVVYEQGTFSKFNNWFFHISCFTAYCTPHWEYDMVGGSEDGHRQHAT